MKVSDDGQVSTTDEESRALIQHRNIVEVSYNIQSAVDSKHNLIIHCEATNKNDSKALLTAALAAKQALKKESLTVLADKGYHNGEQLSSCEKNGITTIVAFREPQIRSIPTADYLIDKFMYDEGNDCYICPRGEVLLTNGSVYKKNSESDTRRNPTSYTVKHYKTKACLCCAVKDLCTNNKYGRLVERSEHTEAIGSNNKRVIEKKEIYCKRQAIVEHPFGTIKRAWGYTYTLLKGLEKVDGEMGLIFTVYNLRRAVSILSVPKLLKLLKSKGRACFIGFHQVLRVKSSHSPEFRFWVIENQPLKLEA